MTKDLSLVLDPSSRERTELRFCVALLNACRRHRLGHRSPPGSALAPFRICTKRLIATPTGSSPSRCRLEHVIRQPGGVKHPGADHAAGWRSAAAATRAERSRGSVADWSSSPPLLGSPRAGNRWSGSIMASCSVESHEATAMPSASSHDRKAIYSHAFLTVWKNGPGLVRIYVSPRIRKSTSVAHPRPTMPFLASGQAPHDPHVDGESSRG